MGCMKKLKWGTFKNLNYLLLTNLVDILLPVATLSLALKYLSTEDYGSYLIIFLLHQTLIALFVIGFGQFFIRSNLLSKGRENLNKIFGCQLILNTISAFLFLLICLFLSFFTNINLYVAFIFFIVTLFSFLNFDWYFYLKQSYKVLFLRSIIIKLSLLVAVYFFLKQNQSAVVYGILVAISCLTSVFSSYKIVKKLEHFSLDIDFIYFKNFFYEARHFFANSLVGSTYKYLDQFLVGILLNKSDLVYLNILKQIFGVTTLIPTTISRFLSPLSILAESENRLFLFHKSVFLYYFFLTTSICFFVALFGSSIINILTFGKVLLPVYSLVISSFCALITSLAVYVDSQHSVPLEKEHITTKSNLVVLILFASLITPAIYFYSYLGALITLMVAEFAGLVIMLYLHNLKYK